MQIARKMARRVAVIGMGGGDPLVKAAPAILKPVPVVKIDAGQPVLGRLAGGEDIGESQQIGRASCRERVSTFV